MSDLHCTFERDTAVRSWCRCKTASRCHTLRSSSYNAAQPRRHRGRDTQRARDTARARRSNPMRCTSRSDGTPRAGCLRNRTRDSIAGTCPPPWVGPRGTVRWSVPCPRSRRTVPWLRCTPRRLQRAREQWPGERPHRFEAWGCSSCWACHDGENERRGRRASRRRIAQTAADRAERPRLSYSPTVLHRRRTTLALVVLVVASGCEAYDRSAFRSLVDATQRIDGLSTTDARDERDERDGAPADRAADIAFDESDAPADTGVADTPNGDDATLDAVDIVSVVDTGPDIVDSGVCPPPSIRCGSGCVNVATDPAHCGRCGLSCAVGATCAGGICACPAGAVMCSGVCALLASDRNNCGVCGRTCGPAGSCAGGVCSCAPGTVMCSGGCASLVSDPRNCGACGRNCALTVACVSAACQCLAGTVMQLGRCYATAVDPTNCGAVGRNCRDDQACSGGVCVCRAGLTASSTGNCVDLQTDGNNCGSSGRVCAAGQACVRGACVPAAMCVGVTLQVCNRSCVDTSTSPLSCGGCLNNCSADQLCLASRCRNWDTATACSTCPCSVCGAGRTCCPHPYGGTIPACIEGLACP